LKSDHASWLAVSCDPNHLMYIDASSPSIDSLLNQLFQPSTSCVQEKILSFTPALYDRASAKVRRLAADQVQAIING
jgi:hypothetical protein